MVQYDFTLEQGDTFSLSFRLKDENGQTINIQSASLHCQGRYLKEKGSLAFDLSTTNSKITISEDNTLTLHLTPTETAAFKIQDIYYDIKKVESGIRTTLVEGVITVDPEVTIQ